MTAIQTDDDLFQAAAEAVVDGDEQTLSRLLGDTPDLITQRSGADHRATLLHYVAANGVEDAMQKTPENAPNIAKILIDAGAEVDALADCYGGGIAQTPLSLLVSSYHPAAAGVQGALVNVLASAGARVDGLDGGGGPLATAAAFGYRDAMDALIRNGAKIQCLQVAAAMGDLARIEGFFEGGVLQADAGLKTGGVIAPTDDATETLSAAFFYACMHGELDAAKLLFDRGAGTGWQGPEGFTALHGATFRGDTVTTKFLFGHGAALEVKNNYDGTPLDTLCWAAVNIGNPDIDYLKMVRLLLDAGASADAVSPFPTGREDLDKILTPRHSA